MFCVHNCTHVELLQGTHMSNALALMQNVHLPVADYEALRPQRILDNITSGQLGLNTMVHGEELPVDTGHHQ